MLDLNFVRENIDIVEKKVRAKKVEFNKDEFLKLDTLRRKLITDSEALKSRKKSLAKEVGMKKSRGEDTADLQQESKDVSKKIASIENELSVIAESFKDIMLSIPNLHDDSVPVGTDEADNKVVRTWGEKPDFDFEPKPHWEIGEINKILDFPRAAKISGSRFALYMGQGAKLERELINLMLRLHTENHGYTEVLPPFMVNDASLIGTGNLPKFKEDLFKIEGNNLYMIPTAEVPLTNIHRDEMLGFKELTRKYVAYTPCFRSEAGSHGRDVRGLVRLHQFNKVELLKFTDPSKSYEELEKLTNDAEAVLQALNLHYRVVALCTGDLSFSSAKTYDLEVWMPSRNAYVEISSCSNFEDFQARRSSIKYKTPQGKKAFVHTINGSGLAAGRTVAAVLENYQTADGRVIVPQVLKDAFNGKEYLDAIL